MQASISKIVDKEQKKVIPVRKLWTAGVFEFKKINFVKNAKQGIAEINSSRQDGNER